jgi:hypothetical protein
VQEKLASVSAAGQFNPKELNTHPVSFLHSLILKRSKEQLAKGNRRYVVADMGCSLGNTGFMLDILDDFGAHFFVLLVEFNRDLWNVSKMLRNPDNDLGRRVQYFEMSQQSVAYIKEQYDAFQAGTLQERKIFYLRGDFTSPLLRPLFSYIQFFICNDFLMSDETKAELINQIELFAGDDVFVATSSRSDILQPKREDVTDASQQAILKSKCDKCRRLYVEDRAHKALCRGGWALSLTVHMNGEEIAWNHQMALYVYKRTTSVLKEAWESFETHRQRHAAETARVEVQQNEKQVAIKVNSLINKYSLSRRRRRSTTSQGLVVDEHAAGAAAAAEQYDLVKKSDKSLSKDKRRRRKNAEKRQIDPEFRSEVESALGKRLKLTEDSYAAIVHSDLSDLTDHGREALFQVLVADNSGVTAAPQLSPSALANFNKVHHNLAIVPYVDHFYKLDSSSSSSSSSSTSIMASVPVTKFDKMQQEMYASASTRVTKAVQDRFDSFKLMWLTYISHYLNGTLATFTVREWSGIATFNRNFALECIDKAFKKMASSVVASSAKSGT